MKKPSNPKTGKKEHNHYRWALTAFVMAVALSGLLSLSSEAILENAGLLLALLILALFIGLGILFDIIGVAVTAADPRPFHSMAAHKEKGAREALKLLRNADRVSSVCNDVVGDICGIVSGATGAVIVARLQKGLDLENVLISVGVTALISGFTAKEAVVSTLAVLLVTNVANLSSALGSVFNPITAVSFLVFTLLYTPCVAALATIRRELGSAVKTIGVVIMQCSVAWLTAFVIYNVIRVIV